MRKKLSFKRKSPYVKRNRRLQVKPSTPYIDLIPSAVNAIQKYKGPIRQMAQGVNQIYQGYKMSKAKPYNKPRYVKRSGPTSDNIESLSVSTIGIRKEDSFAQKVNRTVNPPIQFKRNFQWSAECDSGRKAWFNIAMNHITNDLASDITTYKPAYFTDSAAVDPTVGSVGQADQDRFYIDYQKTKLQFVNSSTNALTGKLHLFAYKRDSVAQHFSVPINPVNMMAYYSTFSLPLNQNNFETVVGNGWKFETANANPSLNYTSNFNMPGSSINTGGKCLQTDLALSPKMPSVVESMNFWFRHISTEPISLKPGQQVNKVISYHDLPLLFREQYGFEFIANMTYCLCVEFQGQIVGDSTATTGDNVISTGTTQLSCVREDIRVIAQHNKLKAKSVLQTAPLTQIADANQNTINVDAGIQDIGVQFDN